MSTDVSSRAAAGGHPRVAELIADMTLAEKLAQLVGLWEGRGGDGEDGDVAPMQDAMQGDNDEFAQFATNGLGQLTRPFGTAPVDPVEGAKTLAEKQRWLLENTRHAIPALVHEECLTGFAAWKATTFPAPLCWGASFDPGLIERMGAAIGASMASVGVHQGLAPVLDVVRDARWGRVEECISEDPYVVGTIATAYIKGVQSSGVDATLKHFVGYSNSRAGRNLAPVHAGPREVADVLLPPFEMAMLDGGVKSVMAAYTEIDGMPVHADPALLTGVLREQWGFEGTVVADYFGVAFLHTLHRIAADLGDAAAQSLTAGLDVELPTGTAFLEPLAERIRSGEVSEELVDRALERVLTQKARLGLLDRKPQDYTDIATDHIDLDPPAHREIAGELAERSVVLLANDGTLPLARPARVAVVGPNADDTSAVFGCYSFANHVLALHPDAELGLDVASVLAAVRAELTDTEITHVRGADVDTDDTSGFADAVAAAREAELCIAVVGDRAGLFGRGTSGEGCDAESLDLPGVQHAFVDALLETGTPVVLVLLTGRPYALDWALSRCAAVVQAFFPGQEGAGAIAGVLSGRINPSGRLPVSLPRSVGAQPYSYLHPPLGAASSVSNIDTAPVRPFGHGLSYTSFARSDLTVDAAQVPVDGSIVARCRVTNTGDRAGADVVQLYRTDVIFSVTQPVTKLLGYARVELEPGQSAEVVLDVPTHRLSFTDRSGRRVVEPGMVSLFVGPDCATQELTSAVELIGTTHEVTTADRRVVDVAITER